MEQIYRVRFSKNLTDSYGRSVDACQGTVEVRASSEARAIELARQRFAELKDVGIWSMRADYEKVELLASRQRIANRRHRNKHAEALMEH
jgi:hypothetical protein